MMETFEIRIPNPSGDVVLRVTVMPAEDADWIHNEIAQGLMAGAGTPYDLMVWLPERLREQGIVDEVEIRADMGQRIRRTRTNPTEVAAYEISVWPGR